MSYNTQEHKIKELKYYRENEFDELNNFSHSELKKIIRALKKNIRDYYKGSSKWSKEEIILKILEKYTLTAQHLFSFGYPVKIDEIFKIRNNRMQREKKTHEKKGKPKEEKKEENEDYEKSEDYSERKKKRNNMEKNN